MTTYSFRVRFNMLDSDRISVPEPEAQLFSADGVDLALRSGRRDTPIKDHSTASVIGGPFQTAEAALSAAERAKDAMLLWGVKQGVGLDFGDGIDRSVITAYGLAHFAAQAGGPIRNDKHGLDVFETNADLRFASMNMTARVDKSFPNLKVDFAAGYTIQTPLSDKQTLALEIFHSSFFDVSLRSRFISTITAVEALLDAQPRSAADLLVLTALEEAVNASNLSASVKQATLSGMQWFRTESIGQAGRRLSSELLPGKMYDDLTSDRFFAKCYEIRSKLVHTGTSPDIRELDKLSNTARTFVGDLLRASAGVAT